MSLTNWERRWIAHALSDALAPLGRDFDAEDAGRLFEARMETMLGRARAAAWSEGAASRQCHCSAYSESECACGGYPSESNPYAQYHPGHCTCVACRIERSSFGTAEAKAARESVSDDLAARAVARAEELDPAKDGGDD